MPRYAICLQRLGPGFVGRAASGPTPESLVEGTWLGEAQAVCDLFAAPLLHPQLLDRREVPQILNGYASITTEMAIRREKGISSSAAAWLRMQMAYDLALTQSSARRIKVKRLARAS